MFNNSKYTRWYNHIIFNARLQQRVKGDNYFERHHIIPRSLGGNNSKENLVLLSAREHYVCHLLLPKMCIDSKHKGKMVYAFMRLSGPANQYSEAHRYTGRLYETMKRAYVKHISGKNSYMYGIPKTKKYREKISKTRKELGVAKGKNNPMFGKKHSKESLKKMSMIKKLKFNELKRLDMIKVNPRSRPVICHEGKTFPSLSEAGKYYGFIGLTAPRKRISDGVWRYLL